jgi:SAM-dependent methyltransferase
MNTLREYYDAEYAGQSADQFGRTPLVRYPRDRYEAAVRLAWSGGDTLLEVGAGSGTVLRTLRPRYHRCIATEWSESGADCLRGLFPEDSLVEIRQGPIEDGLGRDLLFDTVILNHVVEHIVDPIQVLRMLAEKLTPHGRLIITTPNLAKWTRRTKLALGYFPATASRNEGLTTYEGDPARLYDEGHLHYFTFRSLTLLLKERCSLGSVQWLGYPGATARKWPTLFSTDVCVSARRSATSR